MASDKQHRTKKTGVRDVSDPVPFGKRHGDAVRTIASAVSRLSSGTVASSTAQAWNRVHPRLTHRSAAWLDHQGELPLVEGTLIRLKVEHLSKDREAPPVWLWSSWTGADLSDVDRCWQVFLRRFDLEHTFRFAKQTLGWTTPKLRTPEAPDGALTHVGEQGMSLSGGQRQRLALARAIVGRPRLLVLDDPLSALDIHTESLVEEALRRVLATTTALVVAHRPSTVLLADRIALLSGGRITAVGTHDDLLRTCTEYTSLMSTFAADGGGAR